MGECSFVWLVGIMNVPRKIGRQIVCVNMLTDFYVLCGMPERIAIFNDRIALGNISECDLVPKGNIVQQRDTLAGDLTGFAAE